MERERTYKGQAIMLDANWRFIVRGTLFPDKNDGSYPSMKDAEAAIDGRLEAIAKQKKAELTPIPVLNDDGEPVTVRGIHAGQGGLLGVGETQHVYPVQPVLQQKLVRWSALRKEFDALRNEIFPYGISAKRTYGRIRPVDYDRLMQAFTEELEQKGEKAKSL